MKPLASFPSWAPATWDALRDHRILHSLASDPAFPNTPRLTFPDRKSAEKTRYHIITYRANVRKRGEDKHTKPEVRHEHSLDALFMDQFRVSMRNLAYPQHTRLADFQKLPDGPHALYFVREQAAPDDFTAQFAVQEMKPQATKPSGQDQTLRDIGYSTDRDAEPISEDDFFETEPKV